MSDQLAGTGAPAPGGPAPLPAPDFAALAAEVTADLAASATPAAEPAAPAPAQPTSDAALAQEPGTAATPADPAATPAAPTAEGDPGAAAEPPADLFADVDMSKLSDEDRTVAQRLQARWTQKTQELAEMRQQTEQQQNQASTEVARLQGQVEMLTAVIQGKAVIDPATGQPVSTTPTPTIDRTKYPLLDPADLNRIPDAVTDDKGFAAWLSQRDSYQQEQLEARIMGQVDQRARAQAVAQERQRIEAFVAEHPDAQARGHEILAVMQARNVDFATAYGLLTQPVTPEVRSEQELVELGRRMERAAQARESIAVPSGSPAATGSTGTPLSGDSSFEEMWKVTEAEVTGAARP